MKKVSVILGLYFVLGANVAPAQVKLSFNPENGKKYEYLTQTVDNTKESVMGQDQLGESEMDIKYLMEIKNKTSQEIHVQFTYLEIGYTFLKLRMNMGYDSKNPIENPSELDKMLEKFFSQLINQSFMIVFSPDGSVKSVEIDDITEILAKPVDTDDPMSEPLSAGLKRQFTESAIKRMFEQSFKFYPNTAVKVKNRWTVENKFVVSIGVLTTKTKYTLKENKKKIATIAVESITEMTPSAMEGKLSGTQTGTMLVDTTTGILVSSDLLQNDAGIFKVRETDVTVNNITHTKSSIKEVK